MFRAVDIDTVAIGIAKMRCILNFLDNPIPNLSSVFSTGDFLLNPPQTQFDIIVGNPPYSRLMHLPKAYRTRLLNSPVGRFGSLTDIYCLFYYVGLNCLKTGGTICFITSNGWVNTTFGANFITTLERVSSIKKCINFVDVKVFDSVDIGTSILIINKNSYDLL